MQNLWAVFRRIIITTQNISKDIDLGQVPAQDLFGANDTNLRLLEELSHVEVFGRGSKLTVSGSPENVAIASNIIAEMMKVAGEKLDMLKEDAEKMRAKDLHELLRAWENYHRIITAEAHMRHIEFRQESRYPGFYYRADKNFVDEENWKCFVNSIYDKNTKKFTCFKRAHVDLVDKSKLFK